MKQIITLTIIAIILIGAVVYLYSGDTVEAPTTTPTPTLTPTIESTPASSPNPLPLPTESQTGSQVVATYTDSGYVPSTITISRGDRVVFKNNSSGMMWTASAVHPTHTFYDGTSMFDHCPDPDGITFDACESYEPGESWEFQFNKQGTWNYHNHRQSGHTGTVIVE